MEKKAFAVCLLGEGISSTEEEKESIYILKAAKKEDALAGLTKPCAAGIQNHV